jgi:hypothetical protein
MQQWPELHLNMSTLQRPVMLLEVFTPQGSELHLDVSTVTPQGVGAAPELGWTTGACAAPGSVSYSGVSCIFRLL